MKIDRPILIATRRSMLAKAQSQHMADTLMKLVPGLDVRLLPLESEGDRKINHPLSQSGGKGLFTKEIEEALLTEVADLAVHSLKDLPVDDTPGLKLGAIPLRADVRDCLIAREAATIDDLPRGAVVGTSSLRRGAQIQHRRSDVQVQPIRGNIETRLGKVKQTGEFDATLLAVAGLQRGGLAEHADKPIDVDVMLPAAGQAALAIQCRRDDPTAQWLCDQLNDADSALAVDMERRVIARLEADCHSPVAALAQIQNGQWHLTVRVLKPDGSECIEATGRGGNDEIDQLCTQVADELIERGALRLMGESD